MGETESMQVTLRRQRVASLLLRGLSVEEITLQLQRQKLRDPETGQPYGLDVIEADVAVLTETWAVEIASNTARGRVLAELREARRVAWAKGDYSAVYRGLQQEAQLLSLNLEPSSPERPRDFVAVSQGDRQYLVVKN